MSGTAAHFYIAKNITKGYNKLAWHEIAKEKLNMVGKFVVRCKMHRKEKPWQNEFSVFSFWRL